jgi:uncharacterized membrane protein
MLLMQIVIRYPYRKSGKQHVKDGQEQVLLLLISIGGILPLIYIFTDWLTFANYGVSLWIVSIGVVVMLGSG